MFELRVLEEQDAFHLLKEQGAGKCDQDPQLPGRLPKGAQGMTIIISKVVYNDDFF